MARSTGAQIIARSLRDLGVAVIFGIVGIPVVEIAEEAINLGIKFIGFRNEQAAGYAASAYGYLTGKPGICLVVGGPGVLHAIPGVRPAITRLKHLAATHTDRWLQIGNSNVNAFPFLLLAGSSETHLTSKGAFQELDAISFLTPHTKLALRPATLDAIPDAVQNAYRAAYYGRPGPSFVDLPADMIQGTNSSSANLQRASLIPSPPKPAADETTLFKVAQLLKNAKSPLIVIGKGAAYARASDPINALISKRQIPFLPTPMGKGVLPDGHPLNTASARSTALREADIVLLLGARLNWILHFGSPPKWNPSAKFIQVDISGDELGKNAADPAIAIHGDIATVIPQLQTHLSTWHYNPESSPYSSHLLAAKEKNLATAAKKAADTTIPMTHSSALSAIERTLHSLSPPNDGRIVYVSEGANTMDVSRSVFPVSYPRLRLDAGTHATMGVGMGYAIAAYAAYNGVGAPPGEASIAAAESVGKPGKKKIVCLEGDSAFGFSAMEVETMARYGMDILIFVVNNGGVYHGDADDESKWKELQDATLGSGNSAKGGKGLRSTSLSFGTQYEKMADMVGGLGLVARTPEEVEQATRKGWECGKVCVVNVIVGKGEGGKLEFGWQASSQTSGYDGGPNGCSDAVGGEERREKGKGGRGSRL
ncbi:MAG: hypothetical protein L6R40_006037 [Gallowayella cf. fulva]|nr:MAG: hypothetical protein L6R40_006037 [Xanthomendoza cf. fulva]